MATTTTKSGGYQIDAGSSCILRWLFHRGRHTLTCAVEATGRSSYEVCVLPHWNLSASTVEHFQDPASAFRRHAEIALLLRQSGWMTEYGASQRTGVAA